VLVYEADPAALRRAFERALSRGVKPAVYTQELFGAERKTADEIVDRLRFHP
jgi:hypothetical protein